MEQMEVGLAGWNFKVGALFKKREPVKAKGRNALNVGTIQPIVREPRKNSERALLPRFNTMASDQATAHQGDRFAGIRAKLRHAFTPSQPVADRRMFAGREDVLKTIIRSIEDQRLHIVLYGDRGIGKTSLLHMLTQAATEARYIVVYTSCGANSTFDETFRAAADDIPLLFHKGFAPTTAEAEGGSSLAALLPASPLSPRKFGDLCSKLTGTRALIILDEFDRCESGAFRRDVAELIKNLSDRLVRVQLVLAGVAADLTELVEHIPSIRRNIFALRVPNMTDSDVMQIVANGEREAGVTFDPMASASVVSLALGSPYIANLLCHHAGHNALDEGRSTIIQSDVRGAVDRAVLEFQSRVGKPTQAQVRRLFEEGHIEALATTARAALAAQGSFDLVELQTLLGGDAKKAQSIVNSLMGEDLIIPNDDDGIGKRYAFAEDSMPSYLWLSCAQHTLRASPAKALAAAGS